MFEVVALADVWDDALAETKKMVPKAETSKDYHAVLKRKDVMRS